MKVNSELHDIIISRSNRTDSLQNKKENENIKKNEFAEILSQQTKQGPSPDLKISAHAQKRLEQRNIKIDSEEFLKLKNALVQLSNKGGHDSLVITDQAAYIVDVKNNTVVTAMDKQGLNNNVFTKIDSTIFIN